MTTPRLAIAALVLAVSVAACDAASAPETPTLTNPGGGGPDYCPDTADSVASAAGAPIPYPADPGNPTVFDPLIPPPQHFHPCLDSSGALTYRAGMACYVCSDVADFYSMAKGAGCTQDVGRSPNPPALTGSVTGFLVCVPAPDGHLDACSPGAWGCR